MSLDPSVFRAAFPDFQKLITARDGGHRFVTFHEGLAAAWEEYKVRLYIRARP
jgi:hypothetical protein